MSTYLTTYLSPAVFFATPLIVAALGELVSERCGVVNISIEGMMLAGALGAWLGDAWHGPVAALIAAVLAAWMLAIPFAWITLRWGANQIVAGTGINLLALGATGMVFKLVPGSLGQNVGGIDKRHMVMFWPFLALGVWAFFRFTRGGLELCAIGQAPHAADTAGVPVARRQFYAILFGAACAGLAGAYLSIMFNRTFTPNMTDGVGFLALAMVIFGRWRAGGVVAAGMLFGLVRARADHLQTRSGFSPVSLELFAMLPYVVSLAALAGVAGQSGAPAFLGRPYVRE
jgi:simple sugar transport system permease protein